MSVVAWVGGQLVLPGVAVLYLFAYLPMAVVDGVDGTLVSRTFEPLGRHPIATAGIVLGLGALSLVATVGSQVALAGPAALVAVPVHEMPAAASVLSFFTATLPYQLIYALIAAAYLPDAVGSDLAAPTGANRDSPWS